MKRKRGKVPGGELLLGTVALMLFGYSIWTSPTALTRAPLMLGNAIVGVSAAVAPNPDNILAQQLAAKEAELNAREKTLNARSSDERQERSYADDTMALFSLTASIALFALLILNYYLDWRRSKRTLRFLA